MTTSDQALYQALAAFAALTELLGGGPEPRIYPVEAPEEAPLALLVYQKISSTPATTHGEGVTGEEHFDGDVYQLTALAATQLQAAALLYQARLAIEASTTLKGVMVDERALARAEEADAHGRSADFHLWHDPAA